MVLGKNLREGEVSIVRDGTFIQVILLSLSFMFIFTAFQTTGIIEETVLQSLRNETSGCRDLSGTIFLNSDIPLNTYENEICPEGSFPDSDFKGNGYTSLSIIYAVFAVASWLAPSVVAITHPKWSMIGSSLVYVLFIASFLFPSTWLLYLLSASLGIGAAVLWTAQGTFLSYISTPETITRNSGVFWAINQCSLFFGNILVFWQLQGKTVIDGYLRQTIFFPLTVTGCVGVILMCFLKNLRENVSESNKEAAIKIAQMNKAEMVSLNDENASKEDASSKIKTIPKSDKSKDENVSMLSTAVNAFKEAFALYFTCNMLLLSICSIYIGLEYSFLSGVYSTAVGNTKLLGSDSKKYIGLVGILTGVGEVVGGSLFGLLGSRTTRRGKAPIVLLGAAVHVLSFAIIYFNIPNAATLKETNEASFFEIPYSSLALICAVLLGFGDSCIQTQMMSTFASVYQDQSSAAFAIFNFTKSAASAAAFFTSSYMGIFASMITLFTTCVMSLTAFLLVEWRTGKLSLTEIIEEDANSEEIKLKTTADKE